MLTRLAPPPRPRSLEQPGPAALAKSGGGLARYIGLPRWPLLASNRDPTLQEYGIGKPSNNSGAYAIIHSGGQLVRGCCITPLPPQPRTRGCPASCTPAPAGSRLLAAHAPSPQPPAARSRPRATWM